MAAAWYRRNATFSAGSRGRRANHPIGFAPLRAGDAGGEHIARLTALLFSERFGHGVHELAVIGEGPQGGSCGSMSPSTPPQVGSRARSPTRSLGKLLHLLRDRDAAYGRHFHNRVEAMGITEVITAARSPWQNAYVERVIGSIRRECLDHIVIFNERHLRRVLSSYVDYYHRTRTDRISAARCPFPAPGGS